VPIPRGKGHEWLEISPTVQDALDGCEPIVALESTLISHGLPYPRNLETARLLEDTVREHGATPATIAVLEGVLRVGLQVSDLVHLSQSDDIRKVSRRDLPLVAAQQGDGATTVAATMLIAAMAGIPVFATGGIGGVHRGQPFDVSADLPELARTSMIVVCAGAKAILDLPLTLEWLETHGVPVLGYGTATLPAFYTRSTGLKVDMCVDHARQVAEIFCLKRAMRLEGGILVTVPVPAEHAMPAGEIESAIGTALEEAVSEGIRGRAITPYLLARIVELTGGRSLETNIALLKNNVTIAAQIAVELAQTRCSC